MVDDISASPAARRALSSGAPRRLRAFLDTYLFGLTFARLQRRQSNPVAMASPMLASAPPRKAIDGAAGAPTASTFGIAGGECRGSGSVDVTEDGDGDGDGGGGNGGGGLGGNGGGGLGGNGGGGLGGNGGGGLGGICGGCGGAHRKCVLAMHG